MEPLTEKMEEALQPRASQTGETRQGRNRSTTRSSDGGGGNSNHVREGCVRRPARRSYRRPRVEHPLAWTLGAISLVASRSSQPLTAEAFLVSPTPSQAPRPALNARRASVGSIRSGAVDATGSGQQPRQEVDKMRPATAHYIYHQERPDQQQQYERRPAFPNSGSSGGGRNGRNGRRSPVLQSSVVNGDSPYSLGASTAISGYSPDVIAPHLRSRPLQERELKDEEEKEEEDVKVDLEEKAYQQEQYELVKQLRRMGHKKQWKEILVLLDKMRNTPGQGIGLYAYGAAITALGRCNQPKRALALLQEMAVVGIQPNAVTYTAALTCLARVGDWRRALSLLDVMHTSKDPNMEPDMIAYGVCLDACARGGAWEAAMATLQDMEQRGLEPNVVCCNSVMAALAQGRKWRESVHMLGGMQRRGIADVISYNTVINAAVRGRRWKLVTKLMQMMKEWHVQPDLVSYTCGLYAASQMANPAEGWTVTIDLLHDMRREEKERTTGTDTTGSSSSVSGSEASSSCSSSSTEEEEEEEEEEVVVVKAAVQPTVQCFFSALTTCKRGGKWLEALQLINRMEEDIACAQAQVHAKEERKAAARRDLHLLAGGVPPGGVVGEGVVEALLELDGGGGGEEEEGEGGGGRGGAGAGVTHPSGGRQQRFRRQSRRKQEGGGSGGSSSKGKGGMTGRKPSRAEENDASLRVRCYNNAIAACAVAGKADVALALLDRMRELQLPEDESSYSGVIVSYINARLEPSKVAGLFAQMYQTVTARGDPVTAKPFTKAMDAYRAQGDWRTALSLFGRMRDYGGVVRDLTSFNVAINACSAAAGTSQADVMANLDRLLRLMEEEGLRASAATYGVLLKCYAKVANHEYALACLRSMQDAGVPPDVRHYTSAIWACSQRRRIEEALSLLEEMKQEGVKPDAVCYGHVIFACNKAGMEGKGAQLKEEMAVVLQLRRP